MCCMWFSCARLLCRDGCIDARVRFTQAYHQLFNSRIKLLMESTPCRFVINVYTVSGRCVHTYVHSTGAIPMGQNGGRTSARILAQGVPFAYHSPPPAAELYIAPIIWCCTTVMFCVGRDRKTGTAERGEVRARPDGFAQPITHGR